METWVWLAAYLVGFALLQLYLYRYFMRQSRTGAERTTPSSEGRSNAIDPPDDVSSDDLVSCEHCGSYNENHQMFYFCRECGNRLQ
jgi:DNA-directed RNA polymerase subunit RPC12/RpoP